MPVMKMKMFANFSTAALRRRQVEGLPSGACGIHAINPMQIPCVVMWCFSQLVVRQTIRHSGWERSGKEDITTGTHDDELRAWFGCKGFDDEDRTQPRSCAESLSVAITILCRQTECHTPLHLALHVSFQQHLRYSKESVCFT